MMKLVLVFSSALLIPLAAYAGAEGHGGNSVTCNMGTSVELLDYYEGAKTIKKVVREMGPDTAPYQDQVNYVLNRLSNIDPVAAERLKGYADSFLNDSNFLTGPEIKKM